MKTYKSCLEDSIEAAADIPIKRFVGFDGDLCGANEKALGVSLRATLSGEQLPVATHGILLVEAGTGTIDIGGNVTSDATGKAVPIDDLAISYPAGTYSITAGSATPTISFTGGTLPVACNGQSLDASTASGTTIRILR